MAQAMLNANVEGRTVKPRNGYKNMDPAPSGFEACKGLAYVSGYDGSLTGVDEFLSFEKRSGTVKPYSVNPDTGARTVITNGGSALSLSNSDWFAVCSQGKAYCFNQTDGLYRHTLGTMNSFSQMTMPSDPTVPAGYRLLGNDTIDYGSLDPTNASSVSVTGVAANANSANLGGLLRIAHTGSGAASFQVVLDGTGGPGKRDAKYRDCISFSLVASSPSKFAIDPASVSIEATNDAGSPVTLAASSIVYEKVQDGNYSFTAWFESEKTRTDWGDGAGSGKLKKIKISYTVTKYTSSATSAEKGLQLWMTTFGGVRMVPQANASEPGGSLGIGYSYYNSTSGWESDIGGIVEIPYSYLTGGVGESDGPSNRGAQLSIATVATGSADKVRHYVRDIDGYWHKVNEQDDATTSFSLRLNYLEVIACDVYTARQFETTVKLTCAAEFRGSIVWGYADGVLRYSAQGSPEAQASAADSEYDSSRGADWPLSAVFDDKPIALAASGNTLLIGGEKGVYYQIGDRPSTMTPPSRIQGSAGIAGPRAFCAYEGGMAYLTKRGDIMHASENGAVRISSGIAGFICEMFGADLSAAWMAYDEQNGSLIVGLGRNAVHFSAASFIDGQRDWQPYEFAHYIVCAAQAPHIGIVWERISGEIDCFWRDPWSGTNVEGDLRDGGTAMPEGYWKSKEYGDQQYRSRIYRMNVQCGSDIELSVESDGNAQVYQTDGGFALADAYQTGFSHSFQIKITEDMEPVKALFAQASAIGGRY